MSAFDRRQALAIVALVCAGGVAAGTASAQQHSLTLDHQGVKREYILVNAKNGELRPALIVLHGRRDATAPNRSSPALDDLAAREGFVAVYPAGIAGVWNYPTRVPGEISLSKAGKVIADDMGFVLRLIDRLIADRVVDRRRVYVSGASMGGMMTYGLMCRASRRIAGAAAMIANMSERQLQSCKPARAVPVMLLAGMADQTMPYYGRDGPGGRLTSIPETLRFWTGRHGCTGVTDKFLSTPIEALKAGGVSTVRVDYTGCRTEGAVRLYRVDGGGHTLPSRRPQSEEELKRFGPRSTEFETSEEVWAFFKRFRL